MGAVEAVAVLGVARVVHAARHVGKVALVDAAHLLAKTVDDVIGIHRVGEEEQVLEVAGVKRIASDRAGVVHLGRAVGRVLDGLAGQVHREAAHLACLCSGLRKHGIRFDGLSKTIANNHESQTFLASVPRQRALALRGMLRHKIP